MSEKMKVVEAKENKPLKFVFGTDSSVKWLHDAGCERGRKSDAGDAGFDLQGSRVGELPEPRRRTVLIQCLPGPCCTHFSGFRGHSFLKISHCSGSMLAVGGIRQVDGAAMGD